MNGSRTDVEVALRIEPRFKEDYYHYPHTKEHRMGILNDAVEEPVRWVVGIPHIRQ